MSTPGWFSSVVAWSGLTSSVTLTNSSALHDGRADRKASLASGTSMALTFDFGSAKTLAGVALVNISTLATATTLKVEASTNNFSTSTTIKAATPLYTSFPYAGDAAVVFSAVSYRYWRLTLAFASAQTLTLGEIIWAGSVAAMTRRDTYGVGFTYSTPMTRNEIGNGAVYTTQLGNTVKTRRILFSEMRGETERDDMSALWAYSRGLTPVLWVEDSAATSASADSDASSRRCIYGLVQAPYGWRESDFQIFDFDEMMIQETGR